MELTSPYKVVTYKLTCFEGIGKENVQTDRQTGRRIVEWTVNMNVCLESKLWADSRLDIPLTNNVMDN